MQATKHSDSTAEAVTEFLAQHEFSSWNEVDQVIRDLQTHHFQCFRIVDSQTTKAYNRKLLEKSRLPTSFPYAYKFYGCIYGKGNGRKTCNNTCPALLKAFLYKKDQNIDSRSEDSADKGYIKFIGIQLQHSHPLNLEHVKERPEERMPRLSKLTPQQIEDMVQARKNKICWGMIAQYLNRTYAFNCTGKDVKVKYNNYIRSLREAKAKQEEAGALASSGKRKSVEPLPVPDKTRRQTKAKVSRSATAATSDSNTPTESETQLLWMLLLQQNPS